MTSIPEGSAKIRVDEDGFLVDGHDWDEKTMEELARKEGIDKLSSEKIKIIKAMRSHYLKFASFPILAKICKISGSKRRDCLAEEFGNPMLAWKLAGLPKPAGIFYTSFDGRHYSANPFY